MQHRPKASAWTRAATAALALALALQAPLALALDAPADPSSNSTAGAAAAAPDLTVDDNAPVFVQAQGAPGPNGLCDGANCLNTFTVLKAENAGQLQTAVRMLGASLAADAGPKVVIAVTGVADGSQTTIQPLEADSARSLQDGGALPQALGIQIKPPSLAPAGANALGSGLNLDDEQPTAEQVARAVVGSTDAAAVAMQMPIPADAKAADADTAAAAAPASAPTKGWSLNVVLTSARMTIAGVTATILLVHVGVPMTMALVGSILPIGVNLFFQKYGTPFMKWSLRGWTQRRGQPPTSEATLRNLIGRELFTTIPKRVLVTVFCSLLTLAFNSSIVGYHVPLDIGKLLHDGTEAIVVGTPLTLYGLEKDGNLDEAFKSNEPVVKTKATNAFAIINFSVSVALNIVLAMSNTGVSLPWLTNLTMGVIFFGGTGLWLATTKYLQSFRTNLAGNLFGGGRSGALGPCAKTSQAQYDASVNKALW